MSARAWEASAPCSLHLAGGWAAAVDRRASARVERLPEGLEIEWKERLLRARGAEPGEIGSAGALGFAVDLLAACGRDAGLRVVLQCRVPDESGLAPQAALRVALRAALESAGLALAAQRPLPEAPERSAASRLGGVVGAVSGETHARLACDPARVEEALVLLESGRPATDLPGAPLPLPLGELLGARDWTGLGARIASCWPALPSELASLGQLANRLEGGAWLAAGSGGLLVAWLPAGGRAAFLSEARVSGLRPVSCRLDLRGAAGPDA
jgi:hypothetical protein